MGFLLIFVMETKCCAEFRSTQEKKIIVLWGWVLGVCAGVFELGDVGEKLSMLALEIP
jgi:hypothetical protein